MSVSVNIINYMEFSNPILPPDLTRALLANLLDQTTGGPFVQDPSDECVTPDK
jgi:hypothetical protein